jgi:hypothetical protein
MLFEPLENRQLLSAVLNQSTGVLTVVGSDRPDIIRFAAGETVIVQESTSGKTVKSEFSRLLLKKVVVRTLAGADTIIVGRLNVRFVIDAGKGDDSISGGLANDSVRGGGGQDYLFGNAGSDTLDGGAQADVMLGGSGKDTVDYTTRTNRLTLSLDSKANDGAAGEGDNVANDIEIVASSAAAANVNEPSEIARAPLAETIRGVRLMIDPGYPAEDIRHYGASTSLADNSSAINDTINALVLAGGGAIRIPGGVFKYASTLVMQSSIDIAGSGKKSILQYTGSTLAIDGQGTSTTRKIFQIRDCAIRMANFSNTAVGIKLAWNMRSQPILNNVELYNFGSYGIQFTGDNWILHFQDLEVHDCGRTVNNTCGIFKDPAVQSFLAIYFNNCIFEANGSTSSTAGAVNIQTTAPYSARGLSFRDCVIEGNFGTDECYVSGVDNLVVDGCYMEIDNLTTSRNAWEVDRTNGSFGDNVIVSSPGNPTGNAIRATNGSYLDVSGNTFDTRFGNADVYLLGSSFAKVSDRNTGLRLVNDSSSSLIGTGTQAAAWVRFDGVTGAVAASYNVASVTRTATGTYTVTFKKPMPTTKYIGVPNVENGASYNALMASVQYISSSSSCVVNVVDDTNVKRDGRQVSVAFFAEFS